MSKFIDQRFGGLSIPGSFSAPSYSKGQIVYETVDGLVITIATDEVLAGDTTLPQLVPNKGIVDTLMAIHAFRCIGNQVPTAFVKSPGSRIIISKKCTPGCVHVVVRGHMTGRLWRSYKHYQSEYPGENYTTYWGQNVPSGMIYAERLHTPIVTPVIIDEKGYPEDIAMEDIVARGFYTAAQWTQIEAYALKLFQIGSEDAAKRGLLMVDANYLFGLDKDDSPRLIGTPHTPASCHYFFTETYHQDLGARVQQKQLSCEIVCEQEYYELLYKLTGLQVTSDMFSGSDNPEYMQRMIVKSLNTLRTVKDLQAIYS